MSEDPGAVHPARLVDGVAPDVEHGLGRADDAADQRTRGHAHPQLEVVEAVLVDVLQLVVQLGREVDQVADVIVWVILELRWQTLLVCVVIMASWKSSMNKKKSNLV